MINQINVGEFWCYYYCYGNYSKDDEKTQQNKKDKAGNMWLVNERNSDVR